MAIASDSQGQNAAGEEQMVEIGGGGVFDMVSLRKNLPQKRKGLSMYFSGKSRSFRCVADAKCVGDLEKPEIPKAKRRKFSDKPAEFLRRPSSPPHSQLLV